MTACSVAQPAAKVLKSGRSAARAGTARSSRQATAQALSPPGGSPVRWALASLSINGRSHDGLQYVPTSIHIYHSICHLYFRHTTKLKKVDIIEIKKNKMSQL